MDIFQTVCKQHCKLIKYSINSPSFEGRRDLRLYQMLLILITDPPAQPRTIIVHCHSLLAPLLQSTRRKWRKPNHLDQCRAGMASDHTGTALREQYDVDSDDFASSSPEHGSNIPKRHARVTVKYNRKELQRRLDVEKWIEDGLDRLYAGQVGSPEEHIVAALRF